nr:hypothetical transcript [Hymenolepis microstoma]
MEGPHLVQENIDYVKKCVRKMLKKSKILTKVGVTRTIKLSHCGVEKQYKLRIAPNTDLLYYTKDQFLKDDWSTMGFITVHFEPADTEIKTDHRENATKEVEGDAKTAGQIEEIRNRLDKLETFLTSVNRIPVKKNNPEPDAAKKPPRVSNTAPANPVKNVAPLSATPRKSTSTVTTKPFPPKVANGTASKTANPKVSATPAVVKLANNVVVQSTVLPKPASAKVTPVKPVASKAKKHPATKFLVPYNVSVENYPTPLVNSTPHVPTEPQVGGDQKSLSNLKRSHDSSADVVETLSVKKKPRQEQTSDPKALAHLEEIIDAVAVGLDDPNDFAIEPPFTQHATDEQSAVEDENGQEVVPIMDYEEFVESVPKKKKSKKHRHSRENGINGVLE